MTYQLEFEERANYLYVRVTGKNSRDTVLAYTQEMLRHCEAAGRKHVLINECLEGPRLSIVELFGLLDEGSQRAMGRFRAIAFVDEQMGDTADFAENVAVNRGMPIAFFDNMAAAEVWLAGHD